MNNAQKKGLFTFMLELLRLVFNIGSKHAEKHLNENQNDNDNQNQNENAE